MNNLTELSDWQALFQHQKDIGGLNLSDLVSQDAERFSQLSISAAGVLLDYSRHFINTDTIHLLTKLAHSRNLSSKINALFNGDPVNRSEGRPAFHTALRSEDKSIPDGIQQAILSTRRQLATFVDAVQSGKHKGVTGKKIKHIVNIGIGGSHLGPLLTTQALKDYRVNDLQFHFISSVDKTHLNDVWEEIDPDATLFIISSKSFSTIESLTNANSIIQRMTSLFGDECLKHHFAAVTSAANKALEIGIASQHIFPLWDWVGGRYSIWSAIGLPLMLMIGYERFDDFLTGAREMDQHFRTAAFDNNMPVLLALISVWYRNFFHTHAEAIIPYAYRLRSLIPYLQQATMESNGKSVDSNGIPSSCNTSPIIFGEEGCNGQHTYHQLLHQGTHLIPADFIIVGNTAKEMDQHQLVLLASALSQSQALMQGKTAAQAKKALVNHTKQQADFVAAHQTIPGNRPSNILFIENITPKTLGALIALYEHKIFVQSVIWDINPFDQWGVELGKELLPDIIKSLQVSDSSDIGLIEYLKKVMKHEEK